jgi:hypothetical protein
VQAQEVRIRAATVSAHVLAARLRSARNDTDRLAHSRNLIGAVCSSATVSAERFGHLPRPAGSSSFTTIPLLRRGVFYSLLLWSLSLAQGIRLSALQYSVAMRWEKATYFRNTVCLGSDVRRAVASQRSGILLDGVT